MDSIRNPHYSLFSFLCTCMSRISLVWENKGFLEVPRLGLRAFTVRAQV